MGRTRIFIAALIVLALASVGVDRARAADTQAVAMPPATPQQFNGDVRELPLIFAPSPGYRPQPGSPPAPGITSGSEPEPARVMTSASRAPMPAPTHDFAGLSFAEIGRAHV